MHEQIKGVKRRLATSEHGFAFRVTTRGELWQSCVADSCLLPQSVMTILIVPIQRGNCSYGVALDSEAKHCA